MIVFYKTKRKLVHFYILVKNRKSGMFFSTVRPRPGTQHQRRGPHLTIEKTYQQK